MENDLPIFGVKGRSPLSRIKYLNLYKSCPVDAMHGAIGGTGKRLFNCMLDSKLASKLCYIKSKLRNVLHRRLNNFGATSDFKRFPRDLNKLNFWNTTEYFQFIFYESAIVLKDLVDKKCYEHWLLFIYVLSKLWNGVTKKELSFIEELIKSFLIDIEKIYGQTEYTANTHLLIHLVSCVQWFGPLKEYNAFLFEHLNGIIKKYGRSPYALNKQICNEYILNFKMKLNEKCENKEKKIKITGKNSIESLTIDGKKFTTIGSETKMSDYFVKTKTGKFYAVKRFFKRSLIEDQKDLFFEGLEIKTSPFNFNYKKNLLDLDYIKNCEVTETSNVHNINLIEKKVHFVPQFQKGSSKFEYLRKGHLIELTHVHHN